jgi:hypothetical protein
MTPMAAFGAQGEACELTDRLPLTAGERSFAPHPSDGEHWPLERELAAEHREDDFPVAIGRGLVMDVAVGESVAVFRTGVDFVAVP